MTPCRWRGDNHKPSEDARLQDAYEYSDPARRMARLSLYPAPQPGPSLAQQRRPRPLHAGTAPSARTPPVEREYTSRMGEKQIEVGQNPDNICVYGRQGTRHDGQNVVECSRSQAAGRSESVKASIVAMVKASNAGAE